MPDTPLVWLTSLLTATINKTIRVVKWDTFNTTRTVYGAQRCRIANKTVYHYPPTHRTKKWLKFWHNLQGVIPLSDTHLEVVDITWLWRVTMTRNISNLTQHKAWHEPMNHSPPHLMVLAGETVPAVPVLVLAGLLWSRSRAARLLSPLQSWWWWLDI